MPRLRSWVNTYYPGTRDRHHRIQLGRREPHQRRDDAGRHLRHLRPRRARHGARWTTPDTTTPTYKAMKMYRNYDGNKSTFGDTSVAATSTANPDNLSAFAAQRSIDGALTVMVINKVLSGTTPVTVNLANFAAGGDGAGLAADLGERHHPPGRRDGRRHRASPPRAGAEHHAVRRPGASAPANQPPVAAATATPTFGTAPLAVLQRQPSRIRTVRSRATRGRLAMAERARTASTTLHDGRHFTAKLTVTDNGRDRDEIVDITVSGCAAGSADEPHGSPGANRLVTLHWTDSRTRPGSRRARRESQDAVVHARGECRRECHDVLADRDGRPVGVSRARVQRARVRRLLEQRHNSCAVAQEPLSSSDAQHQRQNRPDLPPLREADAPARPGIGGSADEPPGNRIRLRRS